MRYRATARLTTDLDFLTDRWHERLEHGLVGEGFDLRVLEDEGEPHLVRARRTDCAVDLIVATTDYQRLAIERAEDHILTVEDVLVHKLIAWRPRDRDDVASILSTGIDFDEPYVDHWARQWGVEDRWAGAQAQC